MYRWYTNYFIFEKKKLQLFFVKFMRKKFIIEIWHSCLNLVIRQQRKKKKVSKFVKIIIYLTIYILLYFQSLIIYLKLIPKSIIYEK